MDELRRSSGELVGMMGGSAGPSPLFWGFFLRGFFLSWVAQALCHDGSAVPGCLADGLVCGGGFMWPRCAQPFGHPAAWAWGRRPHHAPVGRDGCVVGGVWSEVEGLIGDLKCRALDTARTAASQPPRLVSRRGSA